MITLLLLLLTTTPRVGQITPDARMSSGIWMAGDGFTGSTVRYDNTVTVTPANLEAEFRAALAGPPAIDWSKQGQDAPTTVYDDQTLWTTPNIEQIGAYCVPFVVRGKDGWSKTYRINAPVAYGVAGNNLQELRQGSVVPITGRHLSATKTKSSVWMVDGSGNLLRLRTVNPGGRGTGNVVDIDRSVLWATIPSDFKPGDYTLYVFHGESRWGISNPLPITVIGPKPAPSGVIVTSETPIDGIFTSAKPSTTFQLPPGQFLLTKPSDVGSAITIQGSGKNSTALKGSPSLSADPSKLTLARDSMLRLTGDNITFKDLTIELSPNTTRSAIAAGPGIDSVVFENCRFVSTTPAANEWGYCDGYFYGWGLHRYWKFANCEFRCQVPFERTNGVSNGFGINGAADNFLIVGGSFIPPFGLLSGSLLGSCFGRGTLIYGMDVSGSRRGLALSAGDGSLESVVAACHFHDMPSEPFNGETILFESRASAFGCVSKADANSFTIPKDTQDRTRWTAYILNGTGKGQYRVIKSSSSGCHTLESPWEITPDQSSQVLISQCPTDCSFVFNRFTGSVGGITFYGNAFGNSACSNWFRNSLEGLMLNTNWNSAATSGTLYQNGDGRSVSMWHSFRSNRFEDSNGLQLIAARTTADLVLFKQPQIAYINSAFNTYVGQVSNHLWAAEGLEQKGNEASLQVNLIDYVSDMYSSSYTDRSKYLHKVLVPFVARPIWRRTQSGIGRVIIGGATLDDVPVKDVIETVVRP